MRVFSAHRHSRTRTSSSSNSPYSWSGESNGKINSHDAQMLSSRPVCADPYKVWLEQREAGRRLRSAVPV